MNIWEHFEKNLGETFANFEENCWVNYEKFLVILKKNLNLCLSNISVENWFFPIMTKKPRKKIHVSRKLSNETFEKFEEILIMYYQKKCFKLMKNW